MLTLIGDVHNKYVKYKEIISYYEHTLQVGDMGFEYTSLDDVDHTSHKFFGGNHDNYDEYYNCKHAIGDYGLYTHGDVTFFFVRGSLSIDYLYRRKYEMRTGVKTWWGDKEELNLVEMDACLSLYSKIKPDILIAHDCPIRMKENLRGSNPLDLRNFGFKNPDHDCNTQILLEEMFLSHEPGFFVCGHWHKTYSCKIGKTKMHCIGELECLNIL